MLDGLGWFIPQADTPEALTGCSLLLYWRA